MTAEIGHRPIETRYAGCRFRSRLEARWAVFFNAMRIRWEYEPQGFHLPAGRDYLPDFLLPDSGTWIEVKGSAANVDEELLQIAGEHLPGGFLMLLGPIPPPPAPGTDWSWHTFGGPDDLNYCAGFGGYQKNMRPWWNGFGCGLGHPDLTSPCVSPDGYDTGDAYTAARSARFEHGEHG